MNGQACVLLLLAAAIPAIDASAATLHGQFTISAVVDPLNGNPDTDAFNHLVSIPIAFDLSFSTIVEV